MEKGFPISPDRAIFLADAHLNQEDVHTRNFLALADKATEEKVPLVLLGDVFDLWFGNPGLTFGFQKPIIKQLRNLRREGLRLYYVEGNRDFYLKREHEGTTFDVVSEGDLFLRRPVGEGKEVAAVDVFLVQVGVREEDRPVRRDRKHFFHRRY